MSGVAGSSSRIGPLVCTNAKPFRTAVKRRRAATLERVRELPETMRTAAIDGFGGPGALSIYSLPVPELVEDEVLTAINKHCFKPASHLQ